MSNRKTDPPAPQAPQAPRVPTPTPAEVERLEEIARRIREEQDRAAFEAWVREQMQRDS